MAKFAGYGKCLSRIGRNLLNSMLSKRKYNKGKLLTLQNAIECEPHREMLLEGLKGEV
jgi:hypothetical protein